jgi:hypothetical protein
MTTRTYTTKSGTLFEWEETPEVKKALEELHDNNYEGSLYAPHPNLKDGKETN